MNVMSYELAFARTMAQQNHAAFITFLADDAIFFNGNEPIRGVSTLRSSRNTLRGLKPAGPAPQNVLRNSRRAAPSTWLPRSDAPSRVLSVNESPISS